MAIQLLNNKSNYRGKKRIIQTEATTNLPITKDELDAYLPKSNKKPASLESDPNLQRIQKFINTVKEQPDNFWELTKDEQNSADLQHIRDYIKEIKKMVLGSTKEQKPSFEQAVKDEYTAVDLASKINNLVGFLTGIAGLTDLELATIFENGFTTEDEQLAAEERQSIISYIDTFEKAIKDTRTEINKTVYKIKELEETIPETTNTIHTKTAAEYIDYADEDISDLLEIIKNLEVFLHPHIIKTEKETFDVVNITKYANELLLELEKEKDLLQPEQNKALEEIKNSKYPWIRFLFYNTEVQERVAKKTGFDLQSEFNRLINDNILGPKDDVVVAKQTLDEIQRKTYIINACTVAIKKIIEPLQSIQGEDTNNISQDQALTIQTRLAAELAAIDKYLKDSKIDKSIISNLKRLLSINLESTTTGNAEAIQELLKTEFSLSKLKNMYRYYFLNADWAPADKFTTDAEAVKAATDLYNVLQDIYNTGETTAENTTILREVISKFKEVLSNCKKTYEASKQMLKPMAIQKNDISKNIEAYYLSVTRYYQNIKDYTKYFVILSGYLNGNKASFSGDINGRAYEKLLKSDETFLRGRIASELSTIIKPDKLKNIQDLAHKILQFWSNYDMIELDSYNSDINSQSKKREYSRKVPYFDNINNADDSVYSSDLEAGQITPEIALIIELATESSKVTTLKQYFSKYFALGGSNIDNNNGQYNKGDYYKYTDITGKTHDNAVIRQVTKTEDGKIQLLLYVPSSKDAVQSINIKPESSNETPTKQEEREREAKAIFEKLNELPTYKLNYKAPRKPTNRKKSESILFEDDYGNEEAYTADSFEEVKGINRFVRELKITYMTYYVDRKYPSVKRMEKESSSFIRTQLVNSADPKEKEKGYFVNVYKLDNSGRPMKRVSVWFGDVDGEDTKKIIAKDAQTEKTIAEAELDYEGTHQIVNAIIDADVLAGDTESILNMKDKADAQEKREKEARKAKRLAQQQAEQNQTTENKPQ